MRDAITLTNAERMELTRRATSRTDRAEDARRARLILLLAEGHTWDEISERIDCSRGFVASWAKRFAEQRVAGLYSRHVGQVANVSFLDGHVEARTEVVVPSPGYWPADAVKLRESLHIGYINDRSIDMYRPR